MTIRWAVGELILKCGHRVDHRREHPMSGVEVLVAEVGHRRAEMAAEGPEEGVRQRHTTLLIAQQPLAPVLGIGFAADVTRFDHPVDEIGDRRRRHVHALPQLGQGQRRPRRLADHDVQQGVKVVAAHLVYPRKMPAHAIRARRDRPYVGRQLPFQLSPVGRWVILAAFGHLPASFIKRPAYPRDSGKAWQTLPRVTANLPETGSTLADAGCESDRDPSSSASIAMWCR